MSTNKITADVLKNSVEIERIGNRAVRKAQEENRQLGLPNVYWSAERGMYYELPDGTITTQSPWSDDASKKAAPPPAKPE